MGGRVENLYLFLTFTTMLSPSQSLKALTRMPDEVSLRSRVDEKYRTVMVQGRAEKPF